MIKRLLLISAFLLCIVGYVNAITTSVMFVPAGPTVCVGEFNTYDNPSSDPCENESDSVEHIGSCDYATPSADSGTKNVGSYSVNVAWASSGSGNQCWGIELGETLDNGETYTISFDYMSTGTSAGGMRVGLSTSPSGQPAAYNDLVGSISEDGSFHSYSTDVTAGSGYNSVNFMWFFAATGETSYFDNISVTVAE